MTFTPDKCCFKQHLSREAVSQEDSSGNAGSATTNAGRLPADLALYFLEATLDNFCS